MVKAIGSIHPGPEPTVADGLPYNGTGLFLWVDRDNYSRLEGAGLSRGRALPHIRQFRALQGRAAILVPDGPAQRTFPPTSGFEHAGRASMRPSAMTASAGRHIPRWKSAYRTK